MERDDLIVNDSYPLNAHHSEEEGVKIRKNIIFVTVLLTVITAVEVAMGVIFKRSETFSWEMIKWTFVTLTLVKAGYIVMSFMHLGEERSVMKKTILIPYLVFIVYLVFIAITEGFGHLYNLTNFH
ncbi:MAG: cytochrome C oxidase subunit IV family protein [Flavobacteriales bacterium]|jgi:cytochrome c oxidase subunit 4|tara:strand:- start:474 stop:851 length:378 start_codon:yes stop_codon:yes gene_type:complete